MKQLRAVLFASPSFFEVRIYNAQINCIKIILQEPE